MQFLNISALWALIALCIPIVIHLLAFRKPKRIIFSNVRLLQNVKQATNSYAKLKHILILTSRLLSVAALIFLFAQPFLKKSNVIDQIQSVLLYVDNSASMQRIINKGNSSLLNESLSSSLNLINGLPKSVKFNFLDNSFSTDHIEYSDRKELTDLLNKTDYNLKWRDAGLVANRISKLINEQGKAGVFYYSDFQKTSFSESSLKNMKEIDNLQLIYLNTEISPNLFIDSVYLADEFIRANQPFLINILIRNSGKEEKAANIKLLIGDTQVGTAEVSVPPSSGKLVNFSVRLSSLKEVKCRIILDDQPVTFDNEYFFRLQPSADLAVINIREGQSTALDRVFSNEPIFKYQSLENRNVNFQELDKADLIVLSELKEISSGLLDNIKRRVEAGASLMVIPSATLSASSYQAGFNALGINSIQVISQSGDLKSVAAPSANDPWFSNVFEKLPKNIQTPKANLYLNWSKSGEEILKFSDGRNYLSGFRAGSGNVYVLASPLTSRSDFADNALFVPVMYKIAMYSKRNDQPLAYSIGKGAISVSLPDAEGKESILKLVKDGTEYIPEQQLVNGSVTLTLPGDLEAAGFYSLRDGKGFEQTVALNYDKRESLLDAYSAEELRAMAAPYKNVKVVEADEIQQIGKDVKESYFGTPFWKYALLICLFALALEIAFIRLL